MATAETNRRNPSNSAKWSRVHPDTGLTLKYIHEETEAGRTPLRDIFKGTESGLYLIRKYGQAKVNHNWKITGERYDLLVADGKGDFTPEQLTTAGIEVGESNEDRFAGVNITPGSDSEDHEDIEPREAGLLGRRAPPAAVDPTRNEAEEPDSTVGGSEFRNLSNTMTHRAGIINLPNCEHNGGTKTLFMPYAFLPASVRQASAVINQNLMGMDWQWDNHPGMFQASTFLPVANGLGYAHLLSIIREEFQQEIAIAPDVKLVGSVVRSIVPIQFPEKCEGQLFNPVTKSTDNPVYFLTLQGGATVAITCCFAARTRPSLPTLFENRLTMEQQAEAATAYFPDLAPLIFRDNHFTAVPAPAPGAPAPTPPPQVVNRAPVDNGGIDDVTFRNFLARYNQQEAALAKERADHAAALRAQQQMFTEAAADELQQALVRQRADLSGQIAGASGSIVQILQRLTPAELQSLTQDHLQQLLADGVQLFQRQQQAQQQAQQPTPGVAHAAAGVPRQVGTFVTTVNEADDDSFMSASTHAYSRVSRHTHRSTVSPDDVDDPSRISLQVGDNRHRVANPYFGASRGTTARPA
jgi:hypothetical protein